MPKIIIHASRDTFGPAARREVASTLTDLALECESLPPSPFMKSAVWTYFNDYGDDAVFMGGAPATVRAVSIQVYTIEGGLDAAGKKRFIREATAVVGRFCRSGDGPAPVLVVVHETAESDWGIFGKNGDLAAMRASLIDAPPIGTG